MASSNVDFSEGRRAGNILHSKYSSIEPKLQSDINKLVKANMQINIYLCFRSQKLIWSQNSLVVHMFPATGMFITVFVSIGVTRTELLERSL